MDPDHEIGGWLRNGASCGIEEHPADTGIFPFVGDENQECPDLITTDYANFKNYIGVGGDVDAEAEIVDHIKKGHIMMADSIDELKQATNGKNDSQ